MNHRALLLPFAAAIALMAGCQIAPDHLRSSYYVYEGESVSAHLDELGVVMEDGERRQFAQVYDGYAPFDRLLTPFVNLHPVYLSDRDIHDHAFVAFLKRYDANGNGLVEIPELTVLYAVEGARGMGVPADHLLMGSRRVYALNTGAGDLHGMRAYIGEHQSQMNAAAQKHFAMLDYMYQVLMIRNNDLGGDSGTRSN